MPGLCFAGGLLPWPFQSLRHNTAMHRIRAVFILALLLLAPVLLAPAAHAGDQGDPAQSCDGSTAEMVDCLKAKTAQWDKRMTIAYEKAMKEAGPQQHDQLRAAQRLWIQYRDANCLYYGMGEGTIARIDAGECMRSMTEARARELDGLGHQ
jgi:uncharacterized protein YecT (DUF1311 family)